MASAKKIEFGDFQTPASLAQTVCRLLRRRGVRPAAIVEPTCGIGNLLCAALECFSQSRIAVAADINVEHLGQARRRIRETFPERDVRLRQADFFTTDWQQTLTPLPEPLLVIGNPPWVNNSQQSAVGGRNLPPKINTGQWRGIEAITGKSNFDISEWMLLRLIEALAGRTAVLAMLCKTSVARKVLAHTWRAQLPVRHTTIHRIDAAREFGVAADACLLTCRFGARGRCECRVYTGFQDSQPIQTIGFAGGRLIADLAAHRRSRRLLGSSTQRWRSGIKHDCCKVMELVRDGATYRNALGETVELETTLLFPMLKSSQLARRRASPDRWMLVPQRFVGQDTERIRELAPRTWRYLERHAERLGRRSSSVYKDRPPFSIFGVGPYCFSPWKVAVSGFNKQLKFATIGRRRGKPTMLDDTCYFLPCRQRRQAEQITSWLNGPLAAEFFSAYIFWDRKRPVTAELLSLLDLDKLAAACRRTAFQAVNTHEHGRKT